MTVGVEDLDRYLSELARRNLPVNGAAATRIAAGEPSAAAMRITTVYDPSGNGLTIAEVVA